jgi:hypothetical protein
MLKRSKLSEAKWQMGMFVLKKKQFARKESLLKPAQGLNLHFKKLFYLKYYI